MLIDSQGRQVTYLRVSVTDRCDLRCQYCLPERPKFLPKNQILALDHLYTIIKTFVDLGITKVRITGGEPLMRKNVCNLLEKISSLPKVRELVLTTNATQLAKFAQNLFDIGVARINISLDTLNEKSFTQITRNGRLKQVLAGIEAVAALSFKRIRLNTVFMPGMNDDELIKLTKFAASVGADITFIEEMPLGGLDRMHKNNHDYNATTVLDLLSEEFKLTPNSFSSGGPATYFDVENLPIKVGIIAPHSRNFCKNCNRVRLSCDGTLYPCLGFEQGINLKNAAINNDYDKLQQLIHQALSIKPAGHQFNWTNPNGHVLRYMATTGG